CNAKAVKLIYTEIATIGLRIFSSSRAAIEVSIKFPFKSRCQHIVYNAVSSEANESFFLTCLIKLLNHFSVRLRACFLAQYFGPIADADSISAPRSCARCFNSLAQIGTPAHSHAIRAISSFEAS